MPSSTGSQRERESLRARHEGLLPRLCGRLDECVCEAYRTGVIQSTIVHAALLLVLALGVTATPDREHRVRLTVDFANPVVAPDLVSDGIAETALDTPEADAADVDAAVAAIVVEPAVADPTAAADAIVPDIALAGFEPTGAAPDVSVSDLLAELPDTIPSDPAPRPAVRTVSAVPGRGQAGAIAAANGMGMNGMNGMVAGPGGGIGGEMGRRLAAAGAQTGDVQISIAWNGIDDIDLHVQVEPLHGGMASRICWMSRMGFCGGMLDVDANASPHQLTRTPVENVFWAKGLAPYGRYTIAVHNFRSWSGQGSTSVEVAVLVDGELQRFQPVAVAGRPLTVVHSFVRLPPAVTGGNASGLR